MIKPWINVPHEKCFIRCKNIYGVQNELVGYKEKVRLGLDWFIAVSIDSVTYALILKTIKINNQTQHGNCHCPTKYKENTALGRWVSTQRAEYKKFCEGDPKTSMNRDKIRRLEVSALVIFFIWISNLLNPILNRALAIWLRASGSLGIWHLERSFEYRLNSRR